MLNFLFGGRKPAAKPETQRARFERLVAELNEMIDTLANKPRVTIDPATGHILPETPEQFQDEALALPKPEAKPVEAEPQEPAAQATAKPAAPTPRPPQPKIPEPRVPSPTVGAKKPEKADA